MLDSKDVRRAASLALFSKMVTWASIVFILTLGEPDLLDAIIQRIGGY